MPKKFRATKANISTRLQRKTLLAFHKSLTKAWEESGWSHNERDDNLRRLANLIGGQLGKTVIESLEEEDD